MDLRLRAESKGVKKCKKEKKQAKEERSKNSYIRK